ncbi:MAG: energy transducer TonB [Candidatus Zixiibacteriota bacterium]|nr:MAG: energy transducer TonB [candidate division Zixibacteria bacterium]
MEVKKNPKVDLEKKRPILLEIGFIVSLALIFVGFQYQSSDKAENTLGNLGDMQIEEEIIPITRQQEIKQPPPPPQVVEELNIVEDDEEIDEELEIEDTEADENTEVEQVEIQPQEEEEEILNFYVIENKPEFPGGQAAMFKYIAEHTKYPEIAKENGITGKVFVQFVIGKDGKVTDVKVIRGIDPYLDKEALRVVKSMPKWKPGSQRGKAVKVSFQLPINFTLY